MKFKQITKTKEYKTYVKELSKLYTMLNNKQIKQLDKVILKERVINIKIENIHNKEYNKKFYVKLDKLKKKIIN